MAKCVLIVDDDPVQRRILEEAVKKFGYATETAESGEDAVDILKSEKAGDIALSDDTRYAIVRADQYEIIRHEFRSINTESMLNEFQF